MDRHPLFDPDSNLPPPGTRITPSYSKVLPKIVSPNSEPAIKASSGAHHFRFIGLEIGHKVAPGSTPSSTSTAARPRSPRSLTI